jgi:hypothetical protein
MIKTNLQDMMPAREKYSRTITLLSKGFSNPKAWPGGQITIFPWDSEIDRWLARKGNTDGSEYRILWTLAEKLISLNGASIDDFVVGELQMVLMLARAIRHNNTVMYTAACPQCGAKEKAHVQVPDDLRRQGEKAADYPGFDIITMPQCKDIVKIRPLLVRDVKKIEHSERQKLLPASIGTETAQLLAHILEVGVGGRVETLEEVLTWYRALHPQDSAFLEEQIDERTPQMDSRVKHRCDRCGTEYQWSLATDVQFFRGSSTPEPSTAVENPV